MRFSGKGQPYEGLVQMTMQGPKWTGVVRTVPTSLHAPLLWKRPRRVFVNSMSDLFHESVPFEFIAAVFGCMALAEQHQFQILTKRADRMAAFCRWLAHEGARVRNPASLCITKLLALADGIPDRLAPEIRSQLAGLSRSTLANVLLGVSVEDQERADMRREALRDVADAGWQTWVSYEPALGPVDWSGWEFICWLVSGGESGVNARPSHPDWHRAVRDWCAQAGVPYFFKQWGAWRPETTPAGDDTASCILLRGDGKCVSDHGGQSAAWQPLFRVGKKAAGRMLDGQLHDAMPEGA